jgi:hypothetical protein
MPRCKRRYFEHVCFISKKAENANLTSKTLRNSEVIWTLSFDQKGPKPVVPIFHKSFCFFDRCTQDRFDFSSEVSYRILRGHEFESIDLIEVKGLPSFSSLMMCHELDRVDPNRLSCSSMSHSHLVRISSCRMIDDSIMSGCMFLEVETRG